MSTEASIIGVSGYFIDYFYDVTEWSGGARSVEARECYKHFEHAERRLNASSATFDRIDVISALKRAIDFRVNFLIKAYDLNRAPGYSDVKSRFDKLVRMGLIRPILSRELFDVRNALEHKDEEPPSYNQCARYVEFTWYFLRSTAAAAAESANDIKFAYQLDGTYYEVGVVLEKRPWHMTISGIFPRGSVSFPPDSSNLLIEVAACYTLGINERSRLLWDGHHKYTDIRIDKGIVLNESPLAFRLVQTFVSASSELR